MREFEVVDSDTVDEPRLFLDLVLRAGTGQVSLAGFCSGLLVHWQQLTPREEER
jgi:hypothetical protein